jgi:hypothetical protein
MRYRLALDRQDRGGDRMRVLGTLPLLVILLTVSAAADPDDLEGGVFIVHQVPELAYSSDPPTGDWCTSYVPYAIESCDQQANRVDVTDRTGVAWFVLAAWYEAKTWCATEFGFGSYDPLLFTFVDYGPCFPEQGLEIPTYGWPGPDHGTSLAAVGGPWSGNFIPVYAFFGYAYADQAPGRIPLDIDPGQGFGGTCDCISPPTMYPALAYGALGINTDGIFACPVQPEPGCCWVGSECLLTLEEQCELMGGHWVPPQYCFSFARDCGGVGPPKICCIDEQCFFMVEQQCADEGGEYHAEWDSCDGNPCDTPTEWHVCCVGETCRLLTDPDICAGLHGVWHPEWTSCDGNPCDTPTEWHVCCVGETCRLLTDPDICAGLHGVWHPEWTSCDGNPCDTLPPLAACCMGMDCSVLPETDCLARGGIWMSTWLDCEPNQCPYLPPPPHVCCVGEQCILVPTEQECHDADGFLHPFSPDCDPDPCANPLPGCCYVGADCFITLETECLTMGGIWIPPDYCFESARDCGVGPPQLCCIADRCYFLVEQQCIDLSGVWHPEWDSCDPDPCGGGTPARKWNWGAIKALYR